MKKITTIMAAILVNGSCCLSNAEEQNSSPELMLQQALNKETAAADYQTAAKLYLQIITQSENNPERVVQCMYRLAQCYKFLGQDEKAAETAKRLLSEYPTQLKNLSDTEISKIRETANSRLNAKGNAEKNDSLKAKLESNTVSVNFTGKNFQDAVKAIIPTETNVVFIPGNKKYPDVTLFLEGGSSLDALKYICREANAKLSIEKYAIVISDNDYRAKMETRIFPINNPISVESAENKAPTLLLNDYFRQKGIDFPEGANAMYLKDINKLIVTNTPDNLQNMEHIIMDLNMPVPMVYTDIQSLRIKKSVYNAIRAKSGQNFYRDLMLSPEAETIASAIVVMQNGKKSEIRLCRESSQGKSEFISGNDSTEKDGNKINGSDIPVINTVMPVFDNSSISETGFVINVTPAVDANRYTVALDMFIANKIPAGWKDKSENAHTDSIKKIFIFDGETLLLSSNTEKIDGTEYENIILATARLVNPDGSPIREKILQDPSGKTKTVEKKAPEGRSGINQLVDVKFDNMKIKDALIALAEKSNETGLALKTDKIKEIPDRTVSLDLKRVPYSELLRYLCLLSGTEYSIGKDGIKLSLQTSPGLKKNSFFITPALLACFYPEKSDAKNIDENMLKRFFSDCGISFPAEASMKLEKSGSNLVSINTEYNNCLIGTILGNLSTITPMIEVENRIIAISEKDLTELNEGKILLGLPSPALSAKLLKSDKSKLVSLSKATAASGQEGVVRNVTEKSLPVSYQPPKLVLTDGKYIVQPPKVMEEEQDLGTSLRFTPKVLSNNYSITIDIEFINIKFVKWAEFDWKSNVSFSGKTETHEGKIKMPELSKKEIQTTVNAFDGQPLCIGRAQNQEIQDNTPPDGERGVFFFFVTGRLVNPDGDYARK